MEEGWDSIKQPTQRSPSLDVIEAVADAEGVSPEELCPPEYEPLHEVVDPQALDELFAPTRRGRQRTPGTVTFTFCGYEVTVSGDGTVELE